MAHQGSDHEMALRYLWKTHNTKRRAVEKPTELHSDTSSSWFRVEETWSDVTGVLSVSLYFEIISIEI